MNNTNTITAVNAKEIREMLRNNCLYTFHIWGDGLRARICDVRVRKGTLEVKHLQQGTWHAVGAGHITQL